jgi:hypothetical protein
MLASFLSVSVKSARVVINVISGDTSGDTLVSVNTRRPLLGSYHSSSAISQARSAFTAEWLAIWLEGIALVLIFFWDRIDARSEHQETLAQIAIAKEQAEAAMYIKKLLDAYGDILRGRF